LFVISIFQGCGVRGFVDFLNSGRRKGIVRSRITCWLRVLFSYYKL